MENFLLEGATLKVLAAPVDLNTAAITGARIGLGNGQRVTAIINLGVSLTGANVVFTLRKHTAAAAGTSADLSVAHPYFTKDGAETSFTKVVPGAAAAAYDLSATYDINGGVVVFEVLAEDLGEGYTHFSIDMEDGAVAKLVSGMYVLSGVRNCPAYDLAV